ncbi:MAG: hypothetical protein LC722_08060 [Actinobacteria bacterium]|nr:hypothetical protein [Actinomycetota bacterium]
MAVDERARHQLFQALEQKLGPDEADTLMKLLPPVGWADVATKHDLAQLEERLDLRFQTLEHKLMESFERGLKEQAHGIYQVMATTIAGAMIAVATLSFLAARLF